MLASRFTNTFLVFSLLLIMPFPSNGEGSKLYRWYDEHGKVYFSDKVPPDHAKYKRESLSEKYRIIEDETVEAAKSREQLELEFRLEVLRKEQQKIIDKQHAHDRVIRSTFRSAEDMERALIRKTQSYEIQERIAKNNLEFINNELQKLQKNAANHERNGKKVPQKLLDKITQEEQEITDRKIQINSLKVSKEADLKAFNGDIERFKFLNTEGFQNDTVIDEKLENRAANALGLYYCKSSEQCHKAWIVAKQFVQSHSSTEIELETNVLIMTSAPKTDQDLSLSLSKFTKTNHKPQIFLDIRCRKSPLGKALCSSFKSRQIRTSFRPFIVSKLNP